jgi:hypothetical protein
MILNLILLLAIVIFSMTKDSHSFDRHNRYKVPQVSRIARFPSNRSPNSMVSHLDPLTSPNHYSAFRSTPTRSAAAFLDNQVFAGSYSNTVNHKIKVNSKRNRKVLPVTAPPIALLAPSSSKEDHQQSVPDAAADYSDDRGAMDYNYSNVEATSSLKPQASHVQEPTVIMIVQRSFSSRHLPVQRSPVDRGACELCR